MVGVLAEADWTNHDSLFLVSESISCTPPSGVRTLGSTTVNPPPSTPTFQVPPSTPPLQNGRDRPNPHLSFRGGGARMCLGASLARLEIRVLLEELVAMTRSIERAGPAVRVKSNWVNGVKHLPVKIVGL